MTAIRCALLLLLLAAALSAGEAAAGGLEARVTFELEGTTLEDATAFLGSVTGLAFEIAPAVTKRGPRLGLKVKDMTVRNVLVWATTLTGSAWRAEGGRILIDEAGPQPPIPVADRVIAPLMQKRLDQQVTFDFDRQELTDVTSFLGRLGGLTIVISPRLAATRPAITLAVRAAPLSAALGRIAGAVGANWAVRNEAVFLDLVEAPARKP
jgi:type II secretory pathway component GspD/PulD (secretin)